jgi:hypothetical protein
MTDDRSVSRQKLCMAAAVEKKEKKRKSCFCHFFRMKADRRLSAKAFSKTVADVCCALEGLSTDPLAAALEFHERALERERDPRFCSNNFCPTGDGRWTFHK